MREGEGEGGNFRINKQINKQISKNNYLDFRYTDNQRAQDAMNLTYFHWGIHAWIVYVIIGLLLGVVCYRKGLPLTMRSCFFPLLGDKIFGLTGDLIDILSAVCTMFGVCTSLGLGVIQLSRGLKRLNSDIEDNITNQIVIIWGITALATFSVVTGLRFGIRRLSEICFAVGMFLMLVVFVLDDTWYILNVLVQSTGYYFQWIIQLGFHTDAFAQLGNAPDGKEAPGWMDAWTIFYWGWWISWSPFVGIFIARISRGRTIKEFITHTLTVPIVYTFVWFAVFGGAGLRMERNAAIAGITCNSTLGGATATQSYNGLYRLSCRGKSDMWFDLVTQYGDSALFGDFLSVVSLCAIVLYFVTSSDSGSLVIDCISSNGDPNPPIAQRIFWAFTEGACATALLKAGGSDALTALQTVSIAAGLLYTILLNFMCVALWRILKTEAGDLDPDGPQFHVGIFDTIYHPSGKRLCRLVVAVIAPWWPMGNTAAKLYHSKPLAYTLVLAIPFCGWLALEALQVFEGGLAYVGWVILFGFFVYGTGVRANIRERYGINGNLVEDFLAVLLLYPLAAVQMEEHMEFDEVLHGTDGEIRAAAKGSERPGNTEEENILLEEGHKIY